VPRLRLAMALLAGFLAIETTQHDQSYAIRRVFDRAVLQIKRDCRVEISFLC
jgi:hypothetical protein